MRALTFRDRMTEGAKSAAAEATDPWRFTLARVRGKVDFFDRLERISSQTLLDLLEVPQCNRIAAPIDGWPGSWPNSAGLRCGCEI